MLILVTICACLGVANLWLCLYILSIVKSIGVKVNMLNHLIGLLTSLMAEHHIIERMGQNDIPDN